MGTGVKVQRKYRSSHHIFRGIKLSFHSDWPSHRFSACAIEKLLTEAFPNVCFTGSQAPWDWARFDVEKRDPQPNKFGECSV